VNLPLHLAPSCGTGTATAASTPITTIIICAVSEPEAVLDEEQCFDHDLELRREKQVSVLRPNSRDTFRQISAGRKAWREGGG
jgi:hypothetical protein